MHLLVLGLALSPACAAQSGAGVTVGQKPAGMQSSSPSPSAPAAAEPPSAPVPAPETQPAGPTVDDEDRVALESLIQNTLGKEPTLSHDSVRVAVSADAIELTGSVATSRERLTAIRIAQSYAGSKRVVSRITVGTNPQESVTPEKKNGTGSQRQFHR